MVNAEEVAADAEAVEEEIVITKEKTDRHDVVAVVNAVAEENEAVVAEVLSKIRLMVAMANTNSVVAVDAVKSALMMLMEMKIRDSVEAVANAAIITKTDLKARSKEEEATTVLETRNVLTWPTRTKRSVEATLPVQQSKLIPEA